MLLSWQFGAFASSHAQLLLGNPPVPSLWQRGEAQQEDLLARGAFPLRYRLLNGVFFRWWSGISTL